MNFANISGDHITQAAALDDLDTALSLFFDILDPDNEYDLGGEAGVWFSSSAHYIAPMDNQPAVGMLNEVWNHIEPKRRRAYLQQFIDYLRDSR